MGKLVPKSYSLVSFPFIRDKEVKQRTFHGFGRHESGGSRLARGKPRGPDVFWGKFPFQNGAVTPRETTMNRSRTNRFDALTRQLGTTTDRRTALKALGLGAIALTFGGRRTLAQDTSNGICEMHKPDSNAYFIYNIDEDDAGYNTNNPKHDLWKVTLGSKVSPEHVEPYMGVGLPTASIVRGLLTDDDVRTGHIYGSKWTGEDNGDCKLYDIVTDAKNYAGARAKRGHSGVFVNWNTGDVMLVVNNPDTRVHKVAREDVPALLASFNNPAKGEKGYFDGVTLKWADTGEELTLPIAGSGGNANEAPGTGTSSDTQSASTEEGGGNAALTGNETCPIASPKRVDDLASTPGVAPENPAPDSFLVIDAWGNQWAPNLSPQKRDNATKEERQYDTFALFVRPGDSRWEQLVGLNGAAYAWPKECEAAAVMDFNSKPDVRRITVDAYIKWAQDGTWPKSGAKAKVNEV